MTTPDDQAAGAVAEAIYITRTDEPWYEDYDGVGRAGAMREAAAVLAALRSLGWAPAADTAEQIARAIEAYNASRGGHDETATDCARIARRHGQPRGGP